MLIHELVQLSGVSARTLRYYDKIGLLVPTKAENGYRKYEQQHIDRLHHILVYKELDFSLQEIEALMCASTDQLEQALEEQYEQLEKKRNRLNELLQTIENMRRAIPMSNEQKFEAFKQQLIDENEQKYGQELRETYEEAEVLATYGKLKNMSPAQYEAVTALEQQLFTRLQEAIATGDATSDVAMEVAELHKRWLSFYWEKYTRDAHAGLAMTYLADERFIAYYDTRVEQGATQFLVDAILHYRTLV